MKNVLSRRALLATAGGIPRFARASAPSGRVRVGMIGVGRQTVFVNLKQFLSMPEVAAVAMSTGGVLKMESVKWRKGPAGRPARAFRDYKEVLADKSIDALIVATHGRAIVKGTTHAGVARSLYARYLGN